MRHKWYADGRDLIKWGVLFHLAESWNLKRIIQVAYLHRRPDEQRPVLENKGKSIQLSDLVWSHFRDIRDIKRLAKSSGLEIGLIETPYDPSSRTDYSLKVIEQCRSELKKPTVVFLDPDTGIAERNAKPEHVTSTEVSSIWNALAPSHWLVLYQHSNRHKEWLPNKRDEFAKAIGVRNKIETFRASARTGARDVAFLCAVKS